MRTAGCSAPLTLTSAHALDLRDALGDERYRRHRRCALGGIVFDGQRQDDDRRCRRIGFAESRQRRQIARQIGQRGIDGRLHVARRAVDVAAEVELDR